MLPISSPIYRYSVFIYRLSVFMTQNIMPPLIIIKIKSSYFSSITCNCRFLRGKTIVKSITVEVQLAVLRTVGSVKVLTFFDRCKMSLRADVAPLGFLSDDTACFKNSCNC